MSKYDPKLSKMQSRMRWLEQLKKEKEQEQIQQALKNNTSLTSFFQKAPKDQAIPEVPVPKSSPAKSKPTEV